jgi:hypothetical protein
MDVRFQHAPNNPDFMDEEIARTIHRNGETRERYSKLLLRLGDAFKEQIRSGRAS